MHSILFITQYSAKKSAKKSSFPSEISINKSGDNAPFNQARAQLIDWLCSEV